MNAHFLFARQILSASALLVISFPNNLPTGGRYPKMKSAIFAGVVFVSISLIAGCLSTLIQMRYEMKLGLVVLGE